jgi:hypothetical protein
MSPRKVQRSVRLTKEELAGLAMFPLSEVVLLPHALLPLHIFEPRYRAMTRAAIEEDRPIAMALPLDGSVDEEGRIRVCKTAGVGRILQHESLPDGRYNILLLGMGRVHIEKELDVDTPYRKVRAVLAPGRTQDRRTLESLFRSVHELMLAIRPIEPKVAMELVRMLDESDGREAAVDRIASMFFPDVARRQVLLEESVVERRLAMVVDRMAQYLVQLRLARGAQDLLN